MECPPDLIGSDADTEAQKSGLGHFSKPSGTVPRSGIMQLFRPIPTAGIKSGKKRVSGSRKAAFQDMGPCSIIVIVFVVIFLILGLILLFWNYYCSIVQHFCAD